MKSIVFIWYGNTNIWIPVAPPITEPVFQFGLTGKRMCNNANMQPIATIDHKKHTNH